MARRGVNNEDLPNIERGHSEDVEMVINNSDIYAISEHVLKYPNFELMVSIHFVDNHVHLCVLAPVVLLRIADIYVISN